MGSRETGTRNSNAIRIYSLASLSIRVSFFLVYLPLLLRPRLNLVTSAKTLFPNKVTFPGLSGVRKGLGLEHIFEGDTVQPTTCTHGDIGSCLSSKSKFYWKKLTDYGIDGTACSTTF